MIVDIAGNQFIDAKDIILLRGNRLFSVTAAPFALTVVTPSDLPGGRTVKVVEGIKQNDAPELSVLTTQDNTSVFWDSNLIALAVRESADLVRGHFDFRPLLLNIFADGTGIHVGGMHFAKSTFQGVGTAFNLG